MGVKSYIEHHCPELYKRVVEEKYFIDYQANKRLVQKEGAEALIRKLYFKYFGKQPELNKPVTFNEKLQWLKLNWYDERTPVCSNKHLVREYVRQNGLEDLLIEEYAVFDSANDIDLSKLPDRFVLKPAHDSGHIIICKDKQSFNLKSAVKNLNRWLTVDYEYKSGEWPYSSKKCIVCEKYMEDLEAGELLDYKFFCFNGKP